MANSTDPEDLKKPTDLDLHCLQRQDISRFSRTRVNMSQRRTKPTIRLMRPLKTQISLCICTVWSVFDDRMCLLKPSGCQKKKKREALPHLVDVQADQSLCLSQRSYCGDCCAQPHTHMYPKYLDREDWAEYLSILTPYHPSRHMTFIQWCIKAYAMSSRTRQSEGQLYPPP